MITLGVNQTASLVETTVPPLTIELTNTYEYLSQNFLTIQPVRDPLGSLAAEYSVNVIPLIETLKDQSIDPFSIEIGAGSVGISASYFSIISQAESNVEQTNTLSAVHARADALSVVSGLLTGSYLPQASALETEIGLLSSEPHQTIIGLSTSTLLQPISIPLTETFVATFVVPTNASIPLVETFSQVLTIDAAVTLSHTETIFAVNPFEYSLSILPTVIELTTTATSSMGMSIIGESSAGQSTTTIAIDTYQTVLETVTIGPSAIALYENTYDSVTTIPIVATVTEAYTIPAATATMSPTISSGGEGSSGGASSAPTMLPSVIVGSTANNTVSSTLPGPTISFNPDIETSGSKAVLSGTVMVAAGAAVSSVDVYEGNTKLGSAMVDSMTNTWTFDFNQPAGFHTGLSVVATDSQGLQAATPSDFDLTTGITGEPYIVVQDRYDATADFLGQTFFKPSGVVYLKSTYAALPDGGSSYIYKGGSFFDGKDYVSFTDNYAADGALQTHVEHDKDGSHYQEIDANKQVVTALGNDIFADYAASSRFIFGKNDGEETIYGFKAGGRDHDTLQLSPDAGSLAQVLNKASSDGQGGTMLHVGAGDSLDLINVTKTELKKHPGDFLI